MKSSLRWQHTIQVAAAVALLAAVNAPVASASHRVRYKGWNPGYGQGERRVISGPVYSRSSCSGPSFAGFLGGVVLGAALSHAAPARVEYVYVDPYSGCRFDSWDACVSYQYSYHRPRVVRVIEVDSGDCVRTCRYDHGQWQDEGDDDQDWDH